MNKTLDSKLVKVFPTLYRDRHASMMATCMCWGFDCGDGWYKIIWDLSEKLEPICKKLTEKLTKEQKEMGARYCASQVKEKYGTLSFYMTFYDEPVESLVRKAEKKSGKTCEQCGAQGTLWNDFGWMSTRCDKCHKKDQRRT